MDKRDTPDGPLELLKRGDHDFMILLGGRVLMTTMLHSTERALADLACEAVGDRPAARVLTAGLGLGFTLRALLDRLPKRAQVRVAELNPVVVEWMREHTHAAAGPVLDDPRVTVVLGDVMAHVHGAANGREPSYDAIVLDLHVGPGAAFARSTASLYGPRALEAVHHALNPGGVYAVWGEERDARFVRRLEEAGFAARAVLAGRSGPRHVVYVARKPERIRAHAGSSRRKGPAPRPRGAPRAPRR